MNPSNGMKIKSFFAKSVDAAIAQARVELGAEALLLNTRKLADAGNGGQYEVVMGVAGPSPQDSLSPVIRTPEARPAVRAAVPPPLPQTAPSIAPSQRSPRPEVTEELSKLRARMDELQGLLERSATNAWAAQRSVPEVAEVYARLIAADVDPLLSRDIAARLEAAMATDAFFLYQGPEPEGAQNRWKHLKSDRTRIEKFLLAELESRIQLQPWLGANGAQGAVAALVGAPGSGKTMSLAKLALAAGAQRPVRLVSLDRSRTNAQALLGSLATSAISFSTVDSLQKLPKLVAEARKKECVLIDASGYCIGRGNDQAAPAHLAAQGLAAALASCGDVDVHLVAPAYMKARDLRNSIERYRVFRPANLLVTRMDEAETAGTVFSEAVFAGLALSFFSYGPNAADSIRAVNTDDLLAMGTERPLASHKAA